MNRDNDDYSHDYQADYILGCHNGAILDEKKRISKFLFECYNKNMIYVFGLGNKGEEYVSSRHNIGRDSLIFSAKKLLSVKEQDWKLNKKYEALTVEGKIGKEKVLFVLPEIFMNLSGKSVKSVLGISSAKKIADSLIVVHDDIDLPFGTIKISFGKSSGGHRGVESIIKALKTQNFTRIRLGISAKTASGKIKKPKSDDVVKFVLGKFTSAQKTDLSKTFKTVADIIETISNDGRERASNIFN